MGVIHVSRVAPSGPEFPLMNTVEGAGIQPVLWVDPQGRRFCDESICFYDTSTGNANSRSKRGYTWSVFDDSLKQHFVDKGVDRGMGQQLLPGQRLPASSRLAVALLVGDSSTPISRSGKPSSLRMPSIE